MRLCGVRLRAAIVHGEGRCERAVCIAVHTAVLTGVATVVPTDGGVGGVAVPCRRGVGVGEWRQLELGVRRPERCEYAM